LRLPAALLLCCAAALSFGMACLVRPPVHALIVRNVQAKCALVWFPGCTPLLGARDLDVDEDAGVEDLAGDEDAGVE
jgi:hypothetical protein